MKFLCGNCKAKYQIADEKVSGKTLRMKCRRCGHDILIDGHNMPAQSSPPAASASTRRAGPASVVPGAARAGSGAQGLPPRPGGPGQGLPRPTSARSKPPSALGAEFRRHMAAPPEVPQRAAYDLWHAAINDVPVGPMTREELARKIEAGAVNADSLCWREGMDDWRPLGELPELSQLLRRSREGGPRSGRPPPPRHRPPPHVPAPQGARSISQYPAEIEELADDYSEPMRLAEPSQITSAAAPHAGGTSPKIVVPGSMQSGPAAADASVVAPLHQAPGGWSPMYSGIVVGLLAGILLVAGPMLYKSFWASAPSAAATQTAIHEPSNAQKSVELATRDIQVETASAPEDKPAPAAVGKAGKPAATGVKTKTEGGKDEPGKQLSAEERALLERMGVGGSDINLEGQRPRQTESASVGGGPALTPTQLSKVVQDNKVQLQRCYETALRAAGGRQDGTIKVKVAVTVGMSGTTRSTSTEGAGLGNMNDCIRSAVKRWRFPQSGGESQFEFPLVFQPGA